MTHSPVSLRDRRKDKDVNMRGKVDGPQEKGDRRQKETKGRAPADSSGGFLGSGSAIRSAELDPLGDPCRLDDTDPPPPPHPSPPPPPPPPHPPPPPPLFFSFWVVCPAMVGGGRGGGLDRCTSLGTRWLQWGLVLACSEF